MVDYFMNAGASVGIRVAWFRWDGGAHPGRTHVFTIGVPLNCWLFSSEQCVTDDFGNLVAVPVDWAAWPGSAS